LPAGWLGNGVGGWPERLILLALFAVDAIITQFMSVAATTALFAPVAVALAQALGRAPEPFVVTVAMASVIAFLTPYWSTWQSFGLRARTVSFSRFCKGWHSSNSDLCRDRSTCARPDLAGAKT